MDKTFVLCSAIWATVIVLVVALLVNGAMVAGGYDHEFDVKCIEKGKSVVWTPHEGDTSSSKECK